MKLRMLESSVRLRLTRSEVATVGRGVRVQSCASFPNGEIFAYALAATAGDAVTARFEDCCIEVQVPRARLSQWAQGDDVSISAEQSTAGGVFRILIEKDFTCLHPRDGESTVEQFPNPRATESRSPDSSPPMEHQ